MGLFGEVRDLIKDKHLLIVPSGALTQLPFQVLVTEPPRASPSPAGRGSGERGPAEPEVAWLIRSHAVTVLPAVSALKALRRVGRPSAASRPMIGFGNPLLTGDPGTKEHAEWARLARETQRCPEKRQTQVPRRNTASGLARAFIYAGARALLVSHWAVYSEATQKLVTAALDEMASDAKAGRAEALRRAMLALIDKGTTEEAHPAFWAPFVVVGEGAAR